MTLSCDCDIEYIPEPGETTWYSPREYSVLNTTRRKRCVSCCTLINNGSVVAEIHRFKIPLYDVEINIYGEDGEIPLASHYMCEECSDIYFSIEELGYCFSGWDMHKALKEYQQIKQLGLVL